MTTIDYGPHGDGVQLPFLKGGLAERMGIEYIELSAAHSVARMPVEGNTQPFGLLHGGAHLVLGETLGSIAAGLHGGPDKIAVGIEIGATHSRSISSGWVEATCDAIHLGRALCTHGIVVRDQDGHLLSTVRITNMLRPRPTN